jgi:hypothetical protein
MFPRTNQVQKMIKGINSRKVKCLSSGLRMKRGGKPLEGTEYKYKASQTNLINLLYSDRTIMTHGASELRGSRCCAATRKWSSTISHDNSFGIIQVEKGKKLQPSFCVFFRVRS